MCVYGCMCVHIYNLCYVLLPPYGQFFTRHSWEHLLSSSCLSTFGYSLLQRTFECTFPWQPLQECICVSFVNVSRHPAQFPRDSVQFITTDISKGSRGGGKVSVLWKTKIQNLRKLNPLTHESDSTDGLSQTMIPSRIFFRKLVLFIMNR